MNAIDWSPLVSALDAWRAEGRAADFWLRDDDAVAPTEALSRLLDLCGRHRIPATLAVIPAHAVPQLAQGLAGLDDVRVALHGWSHENHAPPDEKKQELGPHRAAEVVLAELATGVERLRAMFGPRFVPVLVPPWNRIDKALLPRLAGIGIGALSVFGPEKSGALPVVNTHADIMDWHGTRGCRPAGDVIADMVRRLDTMRAAGGSMGLLTHHLVHDEAAWIFLEEMFAVTAGHPGCRWRSLPDLVSETDRPFRAFPS